MAVLTQIGRVHGGECFPKALPLCKVQGPGGNLGVPAQAGLRPWCPLNWIFAVLWRGELLRGESSAFSTDIIFFGPPSSDPVGTTANAPASVGGQFRPWMQQNVCDRSSTVVQPLFRHRSRQVTGRWRHLVSQFVKGGGASRKALLGLGFQFGRACTLSQRAWPINALPWPCKRRATFGDRFGTACHQ